MSSTKRGGGRRLGDGRPTSEAKEAVAESQTKLSSPIKSRLFKLVSLTSTFCEYDEVGGIWGEPAEVGFLPCGRCLTKMFPTLKTPF